MTYIKKFDVNSVDMFRDGRWAEMIFWCRDNLWSGVDSQTKWGAQYPVFYFTDEQEYILFCLRWA